MVWGLGFRVWGLGLGFGVWGLGFRARNDPDLSQSQAEQTWRQKTRTGNGDRTKVRHHT